MNKISAYLLTLMMTLAPHSLAGQAKKPAPPVAPASGVSKTVSLLEKSGYKYTKLNEGVWQIRFE
jgi:hypothetical protein